MANFFDRLYEGYYPEEAAAVRANKMAFEEAERAKAMEADANLAARMMLSPIGNTLQRGAQMQIPARPGALRPNMTMGANGPTFAPTQEPGMAARPAMDDMAIRDLQIRAMGGPLKYFQAQQASAAEARKPISVAAGASLARINPATGEYEAAFTAPGARQKTDLITLKGADGLTKSYNANTQQEDIERAIASGAVEVRTPAAQVTVNNTPENTGLAKMYSDTAASYRTAQDAARSADKMEANLRLFEEGMKGFSPGALSDERLKGRQILSELGIEINGTEQGELLQRVQRQVELGNVPKGQGQITDVERGLIREANNLFGNTPKGAELAIAATRQVNDYDRKVAEIYRANARKNGGVVDPVEVDEEVARLGAPLSPSLEIKLQKMIQDTTAKSGGKNDPSAPSRGGRKYIGYSEDGRRVYEENGERFVE